MQVERLVAEAVVRFDPALAEERRRAAAEQRRFDVHHGDQGLAFVDGGSTCPCNLAPLCRRHHRAKTHSAWRSTTVAPGTYEWTSPHGHRWRVDHTGTRRLGGADPPRR